jgi:hypothetical protein
MKSQIRNMREELIVHPCSKPCRQFRHVGNQCKLPATRPARVESPVLLIRLSEGRVTLVGTNYELRELTWQVSLPP